MHIVRGIRISNIITYYYVLDSFMQYIQKDLILPFNVIKAIIFDYDGIIRHMNIGRARKASKKMGFDFDELMKMVWSNEASQELIRGMIDRDTWWRRVSLNKALKNVPQSFIWDAIFTEPFIDGDVLSYIDSLYERYSTAILSNADKRSKDMFVKEIGSTRFHQIMASSDFGSLKPAEEVFTAALSKLGVEPSECIFFDDKEKNAAGARKVGIHGFLFENLAQMKRTIEEVSTQESSKSL